MSSDTNDGGDAGGGPGRLVEASLWLAGVIVVVILIAVAGCRPAPSPAESPRPLQSGRQAPDFTDSGPALSARSG